MKKHLILLSLAVAAMMSTNAFAAAAPDLTFNGEVLEWNTDWSRAICGTLDITENIIEVSGIACSRVTPGYIWMQSDDVEDYIIATDEKGEKRACKVKFTKKIRWDWEDLAGGVYDGKDYLFIGGFGDNNHTDGEYRIIYFEEPAIPETPQEITITPAAIKYQYPGGKLLNAEALMYDNKTQMIYVITKIYHDVCQVFSIPFRTDYGDELQTLTYVCDLGLKSDLGEGASPDKGFHLVTAADISPDGKYILIKNQNNTNPPYSWILLWERDGDEAISETLKRQPQPLRCYEVEWQGEAICWLDDYTFYTTSDADDDNPPIYKYTRKQPVKPTPKRSFVIDGDFSEWEDLDGLAHATVSGASEYDALNDMRFYADEEFVSFYLEFSATEGDVKYINIMLNVDGDPETGHESWMWSPSGMEYLIETEVDDFENATFFYFDNAKPRDEWAGWTPTYSADFVAACEPQTLGNGHKALEGQILISELPGGVLPSLSVGVFTSNSGWAESGILPQVWGPTLEVAIYSTPTSVESNQSSVISSQKILRNGQLLIEHNGKTYTVTGAEVR